MTSARNIDLDRLLGALAEPHRRRVVDLLRQWPRRAGELAAGLAIPAPAMSRHLRVLRQCGLVDVYPDFDARGRIYVLRLEAIEALKAWVDETERACRQQSSSGSS